MDKVLERLVFALMIICLLPLILMSVFIGFFSIPYMIFFETFLGPILGRIAGLLMGLYFIYLFWGSENKIFMICFLVFFYFFAVFSRMRLLQSLVNMEKRKDASLRN